MAAQPPPPQPLSAVERALRLSADPRSLNLSQVRARALDLHRKLDEAHRRLAATSPGGVAWPQLLAQFGVLSAQLGALSGELRPLAKHYALHPAPRGLASASPWWREAALPNMHSVRLEPAMEAEEAEALARHAAGAAPGGAAPAFEFDALQQAVEAHNGACAAAAALAERKRAEAARALAAQGASAEALQKPAPADVARLLAVASTGEGIRRAAAART